MPHLCSFCQVGFLDTYSLYLHASTKHDAASVTVNEPPKVFIFIFFKTVWYFIQFKYLFNEFCIGMFRRNN